MKNISSGTIARTIILALALVNQALVMFGKSPLNIADDDIAAAVSLLLTIASTTAAWWKNNSFTQNAITADAIKDGLTNTEIYPYKLEKCIKEGAEK